MMCIALKAWPGVSGQRLQTDFDSSGLMPTVTIILCPLEAVTGMQRLLTRE
jgi:hypothetical protein